VLERTSWQALEWWHGTTAPNITAKTTVHYLTSGPCRRATRGPQTSNNDVASRDLAVNVVALTQTAHLPSEIMCLTVLTRLNRLLTVCYPDSVVECELRARMMMCCTQSGEGRGRALTVLGGEVQFRNKRLLNGTKPICVENKGSLEEQTQTKPNNKANCYAQVIDSINDRSYFANKST
jgi:hypothetical protein